MTDEDFLQFLEHVVHPIVRKGADQDRFVEVVNRHLGPDGYRLTLTGSPGGYSEYRVIRTKEGVLGRPKNLIFAANGPKPELVLDDAVNNDVRIVKNEEFCLIYDRPIPPGGLLWKDLVDWWQEREGLTSADVPARALFARLRDSIPDGPERTVFKNYYADDEIRSLLGDELPALVPQVYLHFDPLNARQLGGLKRLVRQRMDFLLMLPGQRRVVIEVDGVQHYAKEGKPRPDLYAEMVAEDRRLKLLGYEVYRFGGKEFTAAQPVVDAMLKDFFARLLRTT